MAKVIIPNVGGRVAEYVRDSIGHRAELGTHEAIGLWDSATGRILGGVVVTQCNGRNAVLHVAGEPGWITRKFLRFVMRYLFVQLGLERVTGYVDANNAVALEFDRRIGFETEFVMQHAAPDGDVVVLVLWRDKCRWL